ncbi:MAG: hypothetical protein R3D80_13345 [Paracoccaceae bacterium]|nr:hypothetical protein [Maritimibacter sp.]
MLDWGVNAMGLEKSTEKLDKYYKRLKKGDAQKIKPEHVEKVIGKLQAKEKSLLADIEETSKETKKTRLQRKLDMIREQQDRAKWLHDKISTE